MDPRLFPIDRWNLSALSDMARRQAVIKRIGTKGVGPERPPTAIYTNPGGFYVGSTPVYRIDYYNPGDEVSITIPTPMWLAVWFEHYVSSNAQRALTNIRTNLEMKQNGVAYTFITYITQRPNGWVHPRAVETVSGGEQRGLGKLLGLGLYPPATYTARLSYSALAEDDNRGDWEKWDGNISSRTVGIACLRAKAAS